VLVLWLCQVASASSLCIICKPSPSRPGALPLGHASQHIYHPSQAVEIAPPTFSTHSIRTSVSSTSYSQTLSLRDFGKLHLRDRCCTSRKITAACLVLATMNLAMANAHVAPAALWIHNAFGRSRIWSGTNVVSVTYRQMLHSRLLSRICRLSNNRICPPSSAPHRPYNPGRDLSAWPGGPAW
jgi:hypothetical protein